MRKKIVIEIETFEESNNEKIKQALKEWIKDNFQKSETAIIEISEVTKGRSYFG